MPASPKPRFRDRVRAWLGTDQLARLNHRTDALEARMTSILELLTGLSRQTEEASAAQQASFLNLHNAVDKLTTNVARLEQLLRDGEASDELQALAARISENLADMKKAADTADNGFEPVEAPTDVQPDADGDVLAPAEQQGAGTTPADVPAEPTTDVPAEDTSSQQRR